MAKPGSGETFNFYTALGTVVQPLATVRIGFKLWEVGRINRVAYGIQKIIPVGDRLYGALGFGASANGSLNPGLLGAVGFYLLDYNWIAMRCELSGITAVKNTGHAEFLVGVNFQI